jgi:hypothetical protein
MYTKKYDCYQFVFHRLPQTSFNQFGMNPALMGDLEETLYNHTRGKDFFPTGLIETLDICILSWFARLNKGQLHMMWWCNFLGSGPFF